MEGQRAERNWLRRYKIMELVRNHGKSGVEIELDEFAGKLTVKTMTRLSPTACSELSGNVMLQFSLESNALCLLIIGVLYFRHEKVVIARNGGAREPSVIEFGQAETKPCCTRIDRSAHPRDARPRDLSIMADILQILPHFSIQPFSHIIPSLDKAAVTTADLLCSQPIDIARRAQVPSNEVAKLTSALIEALHHDLVPNKQPSWKCIGLLDDDLDVALGGGFPAGYVTEVTGER
jgi:hypothetical protein